MEVVSWSNKVMNVWLMSTQTVVPSLDDLTSTPNKTENYSHPSASLLILRQSHNDLGAPAPKPRGSGGNPLENDLNGMSSIYVDAGCWLSIVVRASSFSVSVSVLCSQRLKPSGHEQLIQTGILSFKDTSV